MPFISFCGKREKRQAKIIGTLRPYHLSLLKLANLLGSIGLLVFFPITKCINCVIGLLALVSIYIYTTETHNPIRQLSIYHFIFPKHKFVARLNSMRIDFLCMCHIRFHIDHEQRVSTEKFKYQKYTHFLGRDVF